MHTNAEKPWWTVVGHGRLAKWTPPETIQNASGAHLHWSLEGAVQFFSLFSMFLPSPAKICKLNHENKNRQLQCTGKRTATRASPTSGTCMGKMNCSTFSPSTGTELNYTGRELHPRVVHPFFCFLMLSPCKINKTEQQNFRTELQCNGTF